MQDETYTFIQTVRDRKTVAHSARYRKVGSKSRKCTLPSDYLTAAEKKRRNSAVQTYTMNTPHTKKELDSWPVDLRTKYIANLIERYCPANKDLGEMLGVSETTACTYLRKLGLRNPIRPTRAQQLAFLRFCEPMPEPEPIPVPAVEPEPDTTVVMLAPPIHKPAAPVTYDNIALTFTGTADDLIRVIQTGPIHLAGADTYTFTINAVRKGGE